LILDSYLLPRRSGFLNFSTLLGAGFAPASGIAPRVKRPLQFFYRRAEMGFVLMSPASFAWILGSVTA